MVAFACSESGRVPTPDNPPEALAAHEANQQAAQEREATGEAVREAGRLFLETLALTNSTTNQGPIDIFVVMAEAGFQPDDSGDYANHLPIPPGATGQIAHFRLETDTVVVARITYQNENFAEPHRVLAQERAASLSERVLVDGASIIQIRGTSDGVTEAVAAVLEQKVSRRSQND